MGGVMLLFLSLALINVMRDELKGLTVFTEEEVRELEKHLNAARDIIAKAIEREKKLKRGMRGR